MSLTKHYNPMLCIKCGYPLAKLDSNRCPECGREFDPRDPSRYTTPVGQMRFPWETMVAPLTVLVTAMIGSTVGAEVFLVGSVVGGVLACMAIVKYGWLSRIIGLLLLVGLMMFWWDFFHSDAWVEMWRVWQKQWH